MTLKSIKNITYLFGAGASAGNGKLLFSGYGQANELPNGVPIVKDFNDDINAFINHFKDYANKYGIVNKLSPKIIELFTSLYGDLMHLYSFDTYAKSLYESELPDEREKYGKLKVLLKCYLVFRQLSVSRDRRYDLFFATLVNEGKIPSNVNFLSWNYDTQVESSLSMFTRPEEGNNKSFTKFVNTNLLQDIELGTREEMPFLLKLNGSVGLLSNLSDFEFVNNVKPNSDKAIQYVYEICKEYFENGNIPQIYFSWEHKDNQPQKLQLVKAKEILKRTNILIVVGYSFPTLNRIVDSELLNSMDQDAQIYVQCGSKEHFDEIEVKISSLSKNFRTFYDDVNGSELRRQIHYVKSNYEFYVPFEFNGIDNETNNYWVG